MKIRVTDPTEEAGWDDRIRGLPGVNFFHSRAWAAVLAESYGYDPCYVVGETGTGMSGLVPMMEVKSGFTGKRGVGLPFSDYVPPLIGEAGGTALWERVMTLGRERGWKHVDLKGEASFARDALHAETYWGHQLTLDADLESGFGRCQSSVQRSIRKAERSNLTVDVGRDLGMAKEFYRLHCLTRRRHGLPPQSFGFFRAIWKWVLEAELGLIVLARISGRAVAGAVFFHYGKKVIYKFAASDMRYQSLRPGNLVMWEGVKWFAGKGFAVLDLGRTAIGQEGLRRFKLGFGSEEYAIRYLRFQMKPGRFVAGGGGVGGRLERVFQLLPIWVLRMVGHVLYRHMA